MVLGPNYYSNFNFRVVEHWTNIGTVRQQNTFMHQQSDFEESTIAVDPVVIKHTKINMMDFGSGPVNLKVSKSQTCPDISPTSWVFFSGSNEKFDSISIGNTTTATVVPESLENVSNKLDKKGEAQLPLFRIRNWYNFEAIIQEYFKLE